jgi:hypothetical protein
MLRRGLAEPAGEVAGPLKLRERGKALGSAYPLSLSSRWLCCSSSGAPASALCTSATGARLHYVHGQYQSCGKVIRELRIFRCCQMSTRSLCFLSLHRSVPLSPPPRISAERTANSGDAFLQPRITEMPFDGGQPLPHAIHRGSLSRFSLRSCSTIRGVGTCAHHAKSAAVAIFGFVSDRYPLTAG